MVLIQCIVISSKLAFVLCAFRAHSKYKMRDWWKYTRLAYFIILFCFKYKQYLLVIIFVDRILCKENKVIWNDEKLDAIANVDVFACFISLLMCFCFFSIYFLLLIYLYIFLNTNVFINDVYLKKKLHPRRATYLHFHLYTIFILLFLWANNDRGEHHSRPFVTLFSSAVPPF